MTVRAGAALGRLAGAMAALAGLTLTAEPLRVTFAPEAQRLEIAASGPGSGDYELVIETEGLRRIETGADVNEPGVIYLPPPKHEAAGADAAAENVFFFNELHEAEGWEFVANFGADGRGTWKLNGRFSPLGGEIAREIAIPVARLEPGENLLHVRSAGERVPTFVFRKRFSGGQSGNIAEAVTMAHAAGSGGPTGGTRAGVPGAEWLVDVFVQEAGGRRCDRRQGHGDLGVSFLRASPAHAEPRAPRPRRAARLGGACGSNIAATIRTWTARFFTPTACLCATAADDDSLHDDVLRPGTVGGTGAGGRPLTQEEASVRC